MSKLVACVDLQACAADQGGDGDHPDAESYVSYVYKYVVYVGAAYYVGYVSKYVDSAVL